MLSFVSWQDDLSAESDGEEEQVSWPLQAGFVTFVDCILYFHSFKLSFINDSEFRLLSLKHNAQLSLIRVSGYRWVGCFNHSKKTGAKTRPCFTGFKRPLHVIRLDFFHKVLVSFLAFFGLI